MKVHIKPENSPNQDRVFVNEPVGIFRQEDEGQRVVARKSNTEIGLGTTDITVSRMKEDGTAPVKIVPKPNYVEIHNQGNSNGVTITTDSIEKNVSKDRVATVERSARIEIGYNTTLILQIERKEGHVVQVNDADLDGDIVMGNQSKEVKDVTSVDQSTTVNDSVVNRSSISGDDTNAANTDPKRAKDDGTRKFCEKHERVYGSERCPECTSDS